MEEPTPTLTELKEMTILDGPAVEKIMDGFLSAFNNGLTTNHFTMIPSYVSRLPTGIEVGTYLALELSDTYLRAAVVTLIGLGKTDIEHKQHEIPAELKNGNVGDLFDWVALNVKELLNDVGYELETKDLYAGINFGFPIKQTAINRCIAMPIGNGLNLMGLEGHNIVELLQAAFVRKNVKVNVTAIANDTVGTLVANAYSDQNTIISVVLGTGTNAACICTTSSITKAKFPSNAPDCMIMNTEWNLMGIEFLPFIKYDRILDLQSPFPKLKSFEKMVSGFYLGELVRLTIVDFVKTYNLFGGFLPGGMEIPYSFSILQMTEIESDRSSDAKEILNVLLKGFKFPDQKKPTKKDMRIISEIVKIYSTRSAKLSAAAIGSLIKFQCPDFPLVERDVIVAIDGSMYHKYHKYSSRMSEYLRDIQHIAEDKRTKLSDIEYGGFIGIAIIAMMYSQY
ncbi:3733_t:CDS:2 [Entrophospora sp. SA101]|nr:3733_t:CDS:2 [Entrophospora sp. SA101]CAJ0899545.1 4536_t:CDS:2 [Entrophospora sp. SA101]